MPAKKRALGRGLGSLLPSQGSPSAASTATPPSNQKAIRQIALTAIRPNPFQPRKTFNAEAIEELAASIDEHGILQPLVLREGEGGYQIVAGERRFRAAQRLELAEVPAIIEAFGDQQMLELALIENIQREELNAVEEAHAYRQLIEEFELTQEQVAQRIGKSRVAVTNTLRLLRLPEEILVWIEEEKLTAGHARALLMLEQKSSQLAMAREIMTQGLSVREAERRVRSLLKKPQADPKAEQPKVEINVADLEEKLRLHLGMQVKIHPTSNTTGRVEVLYTSLDDFQRIFDMLGIELEQD